ncbi:bifunctional diaminohydroxyphosphoribosylaminopyrimidine deaminase/5-amino-6-(5-phosphoribosylamino)uracil reductase RibD [Maricaulis sp.]|uniref:bifunctional diaminohydroxyphosphoribosylaminopyrimidine deaminase/5-amino-6-(5-phosphoribosylamino)uracil reductase RibD n=1 Tax=Maricaulis sp. TaxID=1486257 RepID=UPI0032972287
MASVADRRFMGLALALARGQLGRTAPNPAVGCVLVKDGQIVANGATADGGRPHAERVALTHAEAMARGCTAYVTLEPCAHYGRTPPCALGLIEAGIARVVIACLDRYHEVAGRGIAMLEAAGIEVVTGLGEADAQALYEAFFHRLETGTPLLFADSRTAGYETALDPVPVSERDTTLKQLGEQGFSRVRIAPDTKFARDLVARGLARQAEHSRDTVY